MSKRPPLVTEEEFRRIKCNQCGECCAHFCMGGLSPSELRAVTHKELDPDVISTDEWFAALIPTMDSDYTWWYRCSFLEPASKGRLARCTIYERRPTACREFPYGRPQLHYPSCTWNVRIAKFLESGIETEEEQA